MPPASALAPCWKNVVLRRTHRVPDFDDGSKTEKYPLGLSARFHPNASRTGPRGQPKKRGDAGADAFGVLPPIAKLTAGAGDVFTSCPAIPPRSPAPSAVSAMSRSLNSRPAFGSPFLPLDPSVYGNMLRELIAKHNVDCWLVTPVGPGANTAPAVACRSR